MKKGQAAMEFLMTYGWAILVVLAAIGALAYFGVLSPGKLLPDKCTISPGFDFKDCKVTVAATGLQVTILNGIGSDVKNFSIVINTTGGSDVQCHVEDTVTSPNLANGAISATFALCDTSTAVEGQRFDADVKVIYTKSGETLSHTAIGKIQRKIEQ